MIENCVNGEGEFTWMTTKTDVLVHVDDQGFGIVERTIECIIFMIHIQYIPLIEVIINI